ncbi:unnamed protein product [Linum trigynum]|uniref:Uncharacterized protein n=1 Tax=Linum trigynum TaxID=586398 RepID=A0AAV2CG75_9ROSI
MNNSISRLLAEMKKQKEKRVARESALALALDTVTVEKITEWHRQLAERRLTVEEILRVPSPCQPKPSTTTVAASPAPAAVETTTVRAQPRPTTISTSANRVMATSSGETNRITTSTVGVVGEHPSTANYIIGIGEAAKCFSQKEFPTNPLTYGWKF